MKRFLSFLGLFLFAFFLFNFINTNKTFAACSLTTDPSPLREDYIFSLAFDGFTPFYSNQYFVAFESPSPTGNCPYKNTLDGGYYTCTSSILNYSENSAAFFSAGLGDLRDLKAGIYNVYLCGNDGGKCSVINGCTTNNVNVLTSSGNPPNPDPDDGSGQDQTCQIRNDTNRAKCEANPILRYQGTCATGYYCDCSNQVGSWTCEKLECADGSNNCYGTIPEEAEPTNQCNPDECFSKKCNEWDLRSWTCSLSLC